MVELTEEEEIIEVLHYTLEKISDHTGIKVYLEEGNISYGYYIKVGKENFNYVFRFTMNEAIVELVKIIISETFIEEIKAFHYFMENIKEDNHE